MSLDVYLEIEEGQHLPSDPAIFIREEGRVKQITRAEWDERFPDREPVMVTFPADDKTVYSDNITHNLNAMAKEAGIYKHLWRPDEINVTKAAELIEPLHNGLTLLLSAPERFKQFNPENGWGTYEGLVAFVCDYLKACEEYPSADVFVSR